MVCTIVTYRARSAVREVAKALGFPLEGIDALAKALDTRDATDVARDLALDGSFAWLFEELGIDMAEAAVPPGNDGRGNGLVRATSDSSWNPRPRLTLEPVPVSQGSWVPAKRARVLTHRSRRCATSQPRRSATPIRGARRRGAPAADAARQRLTRSLQ